MQPRRDILKGLFLGAAIVFGLVLLTGAVVPQTNNIAGDEAKAYVGVACSRDGQTVYVIDTESVYRSTDSGRNWTIALKKNTQP